MVPAPLDPTSEGRAPIGEALKSVCALAFVLVAAVAIGALASVPEVDRFSGTMWLRAFGDVGLELQDDIGWMMPSLLATLLSFYLFMVGEELAKVDVQVRRRRRLTLGYVGISIAGSCLAVSLLTMVSYINSPALWPNAIAVVTMAALIIGLGAAIGTFEIEALEVRRRAAEEDVESTARARRRVNTPVMSRRRELLVSSLWIISVSLAGFVALSFAYQPAALALVSAEWMVVMAVIPLAGTVSAGLAFKFFAAYRYSGRFAWIVFICVGFVAASAALAIELLGSPAIAIGRIMLAQLLATLFLTWVPFHRGSWSIAKWTVNGAVASNITRSLAQRSAKALHRLAVVCAEEDQATSPAEADPSFSFIGGLFTRAIGRRTPEED